MAEKLWPIGDEEVVREIIPGGHEDRRYLKYPNADLAIRAQRLHQNRFVPKILANLLDDGLPTDRDVIADYPTEEYKVPAATSEEKFMQNTIAQWRNIGEETRHAA